MKFFILVLLFVAGSSESFSSNTDTTTHKVCKPGECNSVITFFRHGHTRGHVRKFTMATINNGSLSDYYASAIGASIHYETARLKGFKFGLEGQFIYKLHSNDLNHIDAITGKTSKYEQQLFDVEHSHNYNDLDRLEELYLDYLYKGFNLEIGRLDVTTPMVNMHDGRMKPKVFQGAVIKQQIDDKNKLFLSWFIGASPRSTIHWYSIEDAIGIYNNGCLSDGSEAHYHGHISSNGLGIVGYTHQFSKVSNIEFWNYHLDNIVNTSIPKWTYKPKSRFGGGLMGMLQLPINNGGHDDAHLSYYRTDHYTAAASGSLSYRIKHKLFALNATHIGNSGRYVFPREFGVDPFFTFISRSQLEGFGNVTAIGANIQHLKEGLNAAINYNLILASDEINMNKYNIPSYHQINFDINYAFKDKWEGFYLRFLYVLRYATDRVNNPHREMNKVNFNHLNLVANFEF